jgi:hypothetical protein
MAKKKNIYSQIIEKIFFRHYKKSVTEIPFSRSEIIEVAKELNIELPRNLGDVIYSFRYRTSLPKSIVEKAPEGLEWIIRPAGPSQYKFVSSKIAMIVPSPMLSETKIPDATPGVIEKYTLNDEQALLAKLRYNRLIDIFSGITCYSLQSHLRTHVPDVGQVETDEIYVGLDKRGVHYILPVQAKGKTDKIGVVQIEQDIAVCVTKFPDLICRPIAAQFIEYNFLALFEFELDKDEISIVSEKHYRFVKPEDLSSEELIRYQNRLT